MKPSEDARADLRLPVIGRQQLRGGPGSAGSRGRSISGAPGAGGRTPGPGRARRPAEPAAQALLGGPEGAEGRRVSAPGEPHRPPRGQHRPGICGRRAGCPAARGAETVSGPGLSPEDALRPAPVPARRTAPGVFRAPGLVQGCGQRGRGVQHSAQREGCSQEAGWSPAPPNLTKVSVYTGAPPWPALCPPDTRPQGGRWRPGRSASRERKMLGVRGPAERPPFALQSPPGSGRPTPPTALPPAVKLYL